MKKSSELRAVNARRWRNLAIVVAAVGVLVAVVAMLAVRMGWFSRTQSAEIDGQALPSIEQLAEELGVPEDEVTADQVDDILESRGWQTERSARLHREDEGIFLGYVGADAGDVVESSSVVVIDESKGPGVPEGAYGRTPQAAADLVADMGVPVHIKKIPVLPNGDYAEGTVVLTYPMEGDALDADEKEDGIYIGIASWDYGVPVELHGMKKDEAKNRLTSLGYEVSLEPHYYTEESIGKVYTSDPLMGSELKRGQHITLYYGVDASANEDLLLEETSGTRHLNYQVFKPMIGTYCKGEYSESSSDCIHLKDGLDDNGNGTTLVMSEGDSDETTDLHLKARFTFSVEDWKTESDLLITSGLGMFELFHGYGNRQCGGKDLGAGITDFGCQNGSPVRNTTGTFFRDTGSTYEMQEMLVYFPVGSDIEGLEQRGYFDDDALGAAGNEPSVDTTRPFILRRDPSMYDTTSVNADGNANNPFLPPFGVDASGEAMMPAVSGTSVYYLQEVSSSVNWEDLADYDEKTETSSDSSSEEPAQQTTNHDDQFDSVEGTYRVQGVSMKTFTQMTIKKDGSFSGQYIHQYHSDDGENRPVLDRAVFTGRFESMTTNYDGTYTLQCDADAFTVEGKRGETYIDETGMPTTITQAYGVEPCGKFVVYPVGFPIDKLPQSVLEWDHSGNRYWTLDSVLATPIIVGTDDMAFYFEEHPQS